MTTPYDPLVLLTIIISTRIGSRINGGGDIRISERTGLTVIQLGTVITSDDVGELEDD